MEEKYNQAIKAGVIGGVAFIVVALIEMAAVLTGSWVILLVLGCLALLLAIIVAAGAGALAVMYARPFLNTLTDAAIVSAIAGLIAGIIYAIMQMITSMIDESSMNRLINNMLNSYGTPTTFSGYSYSQSMASQCCCAPFIIILIIIVAVIGGALYGALVAKIH
jgi:hypothetical protein